MAIRNATVQKGARVQTDRDSGSVGRDEDSLERVRRELEPDLSVVRRLGRSVVAEVFLAREPALKRLVAIKVLASGLAGDASAIRRFEREAQSAARIAHPNVVTVYRVGRLGDGRPYLVMRYVKGRSLGALLEADGPFDRTRACEVLGDIASAVAAGHRRQVVHRDIKPANVLVEHATGNVIVVDFGIAAILVSGDEEPERITTAGHIVGDPQYMSPERLLGEQPDERSDVYNLGLLGYELLTGRGPFEADSNRAWTEAHLNEQPPPISSIEPGIDPRLESLLLRCLAKNPDHRPNAADFETDVRSICMTTVRREDVPPGLERVAASALAVAPAASPQPSARAEPAPPAPETARSAAPPPAPGLLGPESQHYRLDLLGNIDLVNDEGGRVLSVIAQPKRIALLAYLVARVDEPFKRRDRLVSVFWPDLDEEKGRHALRQALYVLRGSLGSEAVVSRGDDEISVPASVLWCDARAFETALAENRPDVAMELYRGPLLPGFYLTDVIEFEHWLDNERLRMERLATEAAWELATAREAERDMPAALHWGRRAVDLAPFDESLLRRLIELYVRVGDRGGALNAYENFARRLRDELEAEPTEQTLALVERIRAG
ncbi:MAG: protein kinase domain-containing protein [Gemmatimonadota bacterium]